MPRTSARFSQADIARAIRAIEQSGADMELVMEKDGTLKVRHRDLEPVVSRDPTRLDGKREFRL